MRLILSFFLILFLSNCDSSLQPESVSIVGEDSTEFVDPALEVPELITPLDSLHSEFKKISKRNDYEGKLLIQFIVDSIGQVKDPQILKWGNSKMNEEVINLVKSARFKPVIQNGKPISVQVQLPFSTAW